jgi:hypothetical protein
LGHPGPGSGSFPFLISHKGRYRIEQTEIMIAK